MDEAHLDRPHQQVEEQTSPQLENQERELTIEDIDAQYLRAVEAMDDADWEIGEAEAEGSERPGEETTAAVTNGKADKTLVADCEAKQPQPRFTPLQILEAALFVGGNPLSSKKLAALLGGSIDGSGVQTLIDELNQIYAAEARPYEIRLGEGGYSLSLRESYARVRNRVFGVGPREVKLSSDALEILAFVAYQQPATREETERTGKQNAGSLLSQLVRRQLIAVHRDEQNPKQVSYRTTERFLSVFGIGSLDELPLADVLETK